MRFFDRKTLEKAAASSYGQKVVLFPGNHFQQLTKNVKELQNELELRDAQRFKNSIAALINSKTPSPKPSLGLFAAPKPKSNVLVMELKNAPLNPTLK